MIKIYPKIFSNSTMSINNKNNQPRYTDRFTSDFISFSGCSPSNSKNRYLINKIVKAIKSDEVKRIAILLHKSPDLDALGTGLGAVQLIEKATGKKADVFVLQPLGTVLNILDPERKVKVISELIGSDANESDIISMFGQYDAAIGVDVAKESLFEGLLYNAVFKRAKQRFKIDHHIADRDNPAANYAQVNLTDPTKESAAQVLMEFVKPFGLRPEELTNLISNPLFAALASDSGLFRFMKTPTMFKDAAILARTADVPRIIRDVSSVPIGQFDDYIRILAKKQMAYDDKIAYFVIDLDDNVRKNSSDDALFELQRIDSVKYFFSVTEKPDGIYVSLRSKDKPIVTIANELGGGGHEMSAGAKVKDKTAREVVDFIIKKLVELDKS